MQLGFNYEPVELGLVVLEESSGSIDRVAHMSRLQALNTNFAQQASDLSKVQESGNLLLNRMGVMCC